MIPRVAYFHWAGAPMSWLRTASIISFARHNPNWEIRLIRTPPDIRAMGLPHFAMEADWSWWRAMQHDGGMLWPTDMLCLKPVPDAWLDADLTGVFGGGWPMIQSAPVGACASSPFIANVEAFCAKLDRAPFASMRHLDVDCPDIQRYGIEAINAVIPDHMNLRRFDIPKELVCPVWPTDVPVLWRPADAVEPDGAIGVHWFGGHSDSKRCEPGASAQGTSFIERLAVKAMA